ncbi:MULTISPECIES: MFS transporter [Gordonia]|uniref:MFS transporter n=1 Tax=Gordonia tangerina TaxID=2911060 RepID=A0ABS9DME2_9ACTN|nr:MFS transporter [Gordonia tangerina]MCF3939434.1 MFS transporter [Gordonia tangerina]
MGATTRVNTSLSILAVAGAIAQILAPVVPFAGVGASPNESTVDLLITPAGYTFSIWSVIYLLSLVFAGMVVLTRSTGTDAPARVTADVSVAFFGAAVWILFSAAEWQWVTSIVLTIMTVALVDAARLVAGPRDPETPAWRATLTRVLVGIYAGWATAAVFQNWASDAADAGADADAVGWQIVVLLVAAVFATIITLFLGGVLIGYPLTVIWALIGIIATSGGETPTVTGVCLATIFVLIISTGISMYAARLRTRAA